MFTHTAEAFVPAAHAECVAKKVRARTHGDCLTVHTSGTHWLLDFGDGRACLKPTREGLYVRIGAHDLLTFIGIRTVLQGVLLAAAPKSDGAMEWHSASNPLAAVRSRPAVSRRNLSRG